MPTEPGFDPVDSYMFLADGGGAVDLDPPDTFWAQLMSGEQMSESTRRVAETGGWLLSGYELIEDMEHWEMHPEGNEILYMLSGACNVVLDEPAGERVINVATGQACLVPQGIWHRQVVIEPGRMLAITYGRGTQHRPQ